MSKSKEVKVSIELLENLAKSRFVKTNSIYGGYDLKKAIEDGVMALKENEARNKGCKYCEGDCINRYCYNCGRKIEGGGIMDKIIRMREEKQ